MATLATANAGAPHIVPVVFAVSGTGGASDATRHGLVYTAVDAKPKSTQRLRRLVNIEANPRVSMLVDHYDDDWSQLWWVRIDGVATVHHGGAAMATGYRLLRAKYAQYQQVALNGPVVTVDVERWSSWHA